VRKPGRIRLRHVEVGRIHRIVAEGRTLAPSSSIHHEPRAHEIRAFLQGCDS
jgi:hypothetical protein